MNSIAVMVESVRKVGTTRFSLPAKKPCGLPIPVFSSLVCVVTSPDEVGGGRSERSKLREGAISTTSPDDLTTQPPPSHSPERLCSTSPSFAGGGDYLRRVAFWFLLAALACGATNAAEMVDPVTYVRLHPPGHTGVVRDLAFSPDSRRLYSAGDDKVVRTWRSTDRTTDWVSSDSYRWEVGYGDPGKIYTLSVDNNDGTIAVGGIGGRGKVGDLIWFDPDHPKAYRSWKIPQDVMPGVDAIQHEQAVRAVTFSRDGEWFASADLNGQVLLWRGSARQPNGELLPPVRRINARDDSIWRPTGWVPRWRPIAWVGSRALIFPQLTPADVKTDAQGRSLPYWRVSQHDPATGSSTSLGDGSVSYPGFIMAIAASNDGSRIAVAGISRFDLYQRSADGSYQLVPIETRIEGGSFIHSLAFTQDGERLVVGRELKQSQRSGSVAKVEVLDLAPSGTIQRRVAWPMNTLVSAVAASDDGKHIACASGNSVYLLDADASQDTSPRPLKGGPAVSSVAFLSDANAIVSGGSPPKNRLLIKATDAVRVFDPEAESAVDRLFNGEAIPATDAPMRGSMLGWTFDPSTRIVKRNGFNLTPLSLDLAVNGPIRADAWCWIVGPNGSPRAIAIGSSVSGGVFVYELPLTGGQSPKLVRRFIGHEGGVRSLVSRRDGGFLASGGDDGTVSLWTLDSLFDSQINSLQRTWGVDLQEGPDGSCRVEELDSQGPLFNRGVRAGDRLTLFKWLQRGELKNATGYDAIMKRLQSISASDTESKPYLEFLSSPDDQPTGLNFAAVWSPVVTIYGYRDAWVAWTPTGHFDASLGGDRLIGWLKNGPSDEAPVFAVAAQHHQKFRRPELLQQLVVGIKDTAKSDALAQQLQAETIDNNLLPEVQVMEDSVNNDGELQVSIEAKAPEGETINEIALIDEQGRKVDRIAGPFDPGMVKAELKLKPVDTNKRIVTARIYSSSGTADSVDSVKYQPKAKVAKQLVKSDASKEVLYLVSVGVKDYDPSVGVAQLEFAGKDAERVRAVFDDHPAYDRVVTTVLTSQGETTGERVREALRTARQSADGNDTIALFFAGHSTSDETGRVHLTPSDGDTEGLDPESLIERFNGEVARTVLILDSCYSGRFWKALRSAVRQADDEDIGISLFASCSEDEHSHESEDAGMGLFTNYVVRGLNGGARRPDARTVSDIDLHGFLIQNESARNDFKSARQRPLIYVPGYLDPDRRVELTAIEE